jgi:hypothetical protein
MIIEIPDITFIIGFIALIIGLIFTIGYRLGQCSKCK